MLTRVNSFFDLFNIDEEERELGMRLAAEVGESAKGMTHQKDYEALAAIALHRKPSTIFEIGTYMGRTSNFFLQLLPDCTVVSIAYSSPRWKLLTRSNNTELPEDKIGSCVDDNKRARFTQLIGDSHKLRAKDMLEQFGRFDMVFIDGDHSGKGVAKDTDLVKEIISDTGVICWHDANPKKKYIDVRRYLENKLLLHAIATEDEYIGGIACWSEEIQDNFIQKGTGVEGSTA